MRDTQYLIFEASTECNLSREHAGKCPVGHPERWTARVPPRPLTDNQIVSTVSAMVREHGFRGLVGWHYYNEPLLSWPRLRPLMRRIKTECPSVGFILWTNAICLPDDPAELSDFEHAHITDYKDPRQKIDVVRRNVKKTWVHRWQLDARHDVPVSARRPKACGRMFSEFIIDYSGEVHACCIDWSRNIAIGNVHDHALSDLVERWRRVRESVWPRMSDAAPAFCQRCGMAMRRISPLVNLDAREAVAPPNVALLTTAGSYEQTRAWVEHHHTHNADSLIVADSHTDPYVSKYLEESPADVVPGDPDDGRIGWANAVAYAKVIGTRFALPLRVSDRFDGPLREAVALHPDENKLEIDCTTKDGRPAGTATCVRLDDVESVSARRVTLRRKARPRPVRMQEWSVVDTAPTAKRIFVTFTHYRLPAKRLTDHFRWNDRLYRAAGARVVVVTDKPYPVPEYARCIVYPGDMPVFALSKTSNYGIRYCIESGADVVVKTDADIVFRDDAWQRCLQAAAGTASVPVYRMCASYADRGDFVAAPKATGTISMVPDDWRKAHFHEGCVGYGCDDGILLRSIGRSGIDIDREAFVEHIAHVEKTNQKEFAGRSDHWNRGDGFNPENFSGNRGLDKTYDASAPWGLADQADLAFVAVHYKMPDHRLRDWIAWNRAAIVAAGARAVIVTDRDHPNLAEPWLRFAVYPVELDLFNLAKTSNYGIRLVGSGIVCKTDIDVVFPVEAIRRIAAVTPDLGVSPPYRMARNYKTRERTTESDRWDASKGTVALAYEHWAAICGYDERMEGYGIEDGELYHRAEHAAGRTVCRDGFVYHIDHDPAHPERVGHLRNNAWNRATGINPKNHHENRRVMRRDGKWRCPAWGKPTSTG